VHNLFGSPLPTTPGPSRLDHLNRATHDFSRAHNEASLATEFLSFHANSGKPGLYAPEGLSGGRPLRFKNNPSSPYTFDASHPELQSCLSIRSSTLTLFDRCQTLLSSTDLETNLFHALSKSHSPVKIIMLSSILFAALAASLSPTFDNAALASARRSRDRDFVENSYIVKLKDGANTTSHINSLPFPFSVQDVNSPITHWWPDNFFKGYCGNFVGATLNAIMASPDVEYVEKNAIVRHMALSFTLDKLNHAHRSAPPMHKSTNRGTSKLSAPKSLSAART
jgi:hypothetical protein